MIRSNTTSFITRFLVLIVSLALVGADLVVLGQNSNSSTTTMQSDNTSAGNMNMSGGRRRRRSTRRRRARRRGAAMNSNAACGPMSENTNMASEAQENANMGSMSMTPVRTGRCDPNTQEQTDLSGTYTGTINYAEGGMNGDATLTITGNDFNLTSGSSTVEGRVVAVTTCNYTAVTMRLGKESGALPTLSLRAKRMGSSLSLMSVSGESKQFSFNGHAGGNGAMAGGTGGRRRRRGRRRRGGAMKMSGNACNPMAHAVTVQ